MTEPRFIIRSQKHLDSARNELLRCAEEVARIQSNLVVAEWKRNIESSYYRQRIYKLEILIAEAEIEEVVNHGAT